ncbi:conserved hypothetical protein [Rhodococcus jostii RHA1]|uniref:PIN like domain-containing protein n=1 Tax=Rhodococcus jostii (strain RHA1) TaxID=101510 RepID=Q0SC22_RHOJR|nr:PIN domain-containing protein [Rhodococcus jostii]ABG94914.1 conserved hypothetical protein [Rhodococcus jostii RHA1]
MRGTFPEWYSPDDSTLKTVVAGGVIALDANILHHLYRLGGQQRDKVLSVLTHDEVRSRLWLPYQAGLEYHRNRLKSAYDQSEVYKKLNKEIAKHKGQIRTLIEGQISDPDVRSTALATLGEAFTTLSNRLTELGSEHVIDYQEVRQSDPVRNTLDNIFRDEGQIGTEPTSETLAARINDATKRYQKKIPPGYMDASGPGKKDNPEGDFLIWGELLDHAETDNRPLLFVTNDEKEDWYALDAAGQIVGPRPELLVEMRQRSAHPYHQTTLTGFLRLAKKYLNVQVDDATIDRVDATIEVPSIRVEAKFSATGKLESVVQVDGDGIPQPNLSSPPPAAVVHGMLTDVLQKLEPGTRAYEEISSKVRSIELGTLPDTPDMQLTWELIRYVATHSTPVTEELDQIIDVAGSARRPD